MIDSITYTIFYIEDNWRDIDVAARHRDSDTYGFENADFYELTDVASDTYLGFMEIDDDRKGWTYKGSGLNEAEEKEIGDYIINFYDPDF